MKTDEIQEETHSSIPEGNYEEKKQEPRKKESDEPVSTSTHSGDTLAPSDFIVSRKDNLTTQFFVNIAVEEKKRRQIEYNRELRRLRRTSKGTSY